MSHRKHRNHRKRGGDYWSSLRSSKSIKNQIQNLTIMALDLNAIKAAAAKMQEQAQPKGESKGTQKAQKTQNAEGVASEKRERSGKAAPKSAPKTDSPKTKGGAKYVIPAEFKQAIENHLQGRADMKEKLSKKGKSIDGCCDYIFDVMRKRAEKERGGARAVGLYSDPNEIFGLAVHYYDETEESLKAEK